MLGSGSSWTTSCEQLNSALNCAQIAAWNCACVIGVVTPLVVVTAWFVSTSRAPLLGAGLEVGFGEEDDADLKRRQDAAR